MKHLKHIFEDWKSSDIKEIVDTLIDICLEIEDIGYEIDISSKRKMIYCSKNVKLRDYGTRLDFGHNNYLSGFKDPNIDDKINPVDLTITITKEERFFSRAQIKDTYLRIRDYMESEGYNTSIVTGNQCSISFSTSQRFRRRHSDKINIKESYQTDNELLHNIEDICQELIDIGFKTHFISESPAVYKRRINPFRKQPDVQRNPDEKYLIVQHETCKNIKWEEIKDCPLRIKDYLGDRFISFKYLQIHGSTPSYWEAELNDESDIPPINSFRIRFHSSSYNESKIFESMNFEISTNIREIFYELTDIGYDVVIYWMPSEKCVRITKKENSFSTSKKIIRETILRLNDYLEDTNLEILNICGGNHKFLKIEQFLKENYMTQWINIYLREK